MTHRRVHRVCVAWYRRVTLPHARQAAARGWRPGQTKEYHVYRLVGHGTMDERVAHMARKKERIASLVVDEEVQQHLPVLTDL